MSNFIKNTGSDRYTVFPIKYQNLWEHYKNHLSTFWTVEEILLHEDLSDWNNKLNDNERFFIKNVLAFFASSDGIVNENLVTNFYNEVQIPEARAFYTVQMMMESCHNEMYSLLIDTYISDSKEKDQLFRAMETIPAIKKKAEWAIRYIDEGTTIIENIPIEAMEAIKKAQALGIENLEFFTKQRPSFSQRLLAFICIEGIFFSGSFCAIYWIKNKGLLPGLSVSNDFISKEENLHCIFAIDLYNMIDDNERLDEKTVYDIFTDAVDIEKEFVTQSLPVSLLGMNCSLMSQYIEFVADRWLNKLGYNKLYNTENPFGFMELISLSSKTNFFEKTVTEYSRAGVGNNTEDNQIAFDDDF